MLEAVRLAQLIKPFRERLMDIAAADLGMLAEALGSAYQRLAR